MFVYQLNHLAVTQEYFTSKDPGTGNKKLSRNSDLVEFTLLQMFHTEERDNAAMKER